MKKLSGLCIPVLFAVLFCSCGNSADPSLIRIDTSRDYPESDLRLSDVAEVKYIPLQYGKDSIFFVNPGSLAVTVFRDTLFIFNWKRPLTSRIILYDTLGNLLSCIDRLGRGPGEYTFLKSYAADTLRREIYAWDYNLLKMLVYDYSGNCLRDTIFEDKYSAVIHLNNDYLLGFCHNTRMKSILESGKIIDNKCKPLTFIGKDDFKEQSVDFDYLEPHPGGMSCVVENLSVMKEGIYITSDRSDTVYFMDRYLKLTPRIVNLTPHSERRMSLVLPTIETGRYLFLSNEYYGDNNIPRKRSDFYVYDKKQKQIYRLKKDASLPSEFLLLANNYIAMNQFSLTQNHNYSAVFASPVHLHENYERLPPQLKAITDRLDDMDNPVLLLIKFK